MALIFSGFLPSRLSAGVLLSNEILMETPSFMPYLCWCIHNIQHKASYLLIRDCVTMGRLLRMQFQHYPWLLVQW